MREQELAFISKALRICLEITFVVGAVITVFLWLILREWFSWYFWNNATYYRACVLLLTPCGLCSLYIIRQLISLLKTVGNHDPFVFANVRGLRRIAVSSFIISAMFTALMLVQATVLTFAIAYIFLIAGFCFIVLASLFGRAVVYKNENDLTV